MKRTIWWICGSVVLAGTVATAFASAGKLGSETLAVLMRSTDSAAFFLVGVGLLGLARKRDRQPGDEPEK